MTGRLCARFRSLIERVQEGLLLPRMSLPGTAPSALCRFCGFAIGVPAQAEVPTVIDYPDGGITTGQGGNRFAVAETAATCIVWREVMQRAISRGSGSNGPPTTIGNPGRTRRPAGNAG